MRHRSEILTRQKPLIATYLVAPEKAWITDVAVIEGKEFDDPFHSEVLMNEELKRRLPVGVHRAVGGLHDAPNPGDILCTSLAACFETTLRLIADRLGIQLVSTKVKATAEVDVRGTLMVDRDVPVAFQKMSLETEIRTQAVKSELYELLLSATERSCIVLQTLKQALPIDIKHQVSEGINALKQ